MTDAQDFASYLRRAMELAGVTQADLSRAIGVKDSVISRWLKGSIPTIENLRLLAPVLRVPVRDLVVAAGHMLPEEVGLTEPPEPPEPRPPTAEEGIRAEPYLSDVKKELFIGLLNEMRDENAENEPEAKRKRA